MVSTAITNRIPFIQPWVEQTWEFFCTTIGVTNTDLVEPLLKHGGADM